MACSIRQNDKIQGIKIKNEEVKLSLFADDMTCFLRNKSPYQHLSSSLECFSKFSGLKLNEEKTEFFRLGVHNLGEWFRHEFKLSIQILGVHFDNDELSRKKANFEAILKSIKRTLNTWNREGLLLLGIPKFMSKASLTHVSNYLIQAADKEFFNFIWKGKDKIKLCALINDIEYGG